MCKRDYMDWNLFLYYICYWVRLSLIKYYIEENF